MSGGGGAGGTEGVDRDTERQGLWFGLAALGLSGYHWLIGWGEGPETVMVLAGLIVLLGVPHGALDGLYAGRLFGLATGWQWLLFTGAYLAPVVTVLVLWPRAPGLFLLVFLVVSVFHFAGDRGPDCPWWLRLLYGGAPVVLPAVAHGETLERLLGALVPAPVAASFAAGLEVMSWPWLVALAVGAVWRARGGWREAMEVGAVGVLCTVTPPLASFTLFFCGMHSARHILRSLRVEDRAKGRFAQVIGAGGATMVATLALLAIYWGSARAEAMEPRLLQTVFVGLAALTFPHVVLVDWFSRWRGARGTPE